MIAFVIAIIVVKVQSVWKVSPLLLLEGFKAHVYTQNYIQFH